jgi:hypothetical protein
MASAVSRCASFENRRVEDEKLNDDVGIEHDLALIVDDLSAGAFHARPTGHR